MNAQAIRQLVFAVALIAAAGAIVLTGLRGFSDQAGSAAAPIVAPLPVSAEEFAKLTRATTYTTTPAASPDQDPFAATGGLVLHPLTAQVVYAGPGQKPVAVLPATQLDGPTWVPVVQSSPGWDRVLLPSRPNRATGWIYTGETASSGVTIRRSAYVIRIQVGARKLSVDDNGASVGTWTVAVGAPGTPTPTGRRAYAPSRSPSGAWLNASRMIEVAIGRTISATTVPAMKVEEV